MFWLSHMSVVSTVCAKHSAVTLELETANEKHVDDLKQRLINEKYEVIFK